MASSRAGALRAVAVELDVCADGPTIDNSVQKGWDAFGRIDVLINNAGVRGDSSNKNTLTALLVFSCVS